MGAKTNFMTWPETSAGVIYNSESLRSAGRSPAADFWNQREKKLCGNRNYFQIWVRTDRWAEGKCGCCWCYDLLGTPFSEVQRCAICGGCHHKGCRHHGCKLDCSRRRGTGDVVGEEWLSHTGSRHKSVRQ